MSDNTKTLSTAPKPKRQGDLRMVYQKLDELFDDVLAHSGFGELRIDVRWAKRNQKEIVLSCGKQYRFVVDVPPECLDPRT